MATAYEVTQLMKGHAIMADSEREKFAAIQEAAEPAFQAFGDKAPAPLAGETTLAYRRRLIGKHQQHSSAWKETRLTAIADEAALLAVTPGTKILMDAKTNNAMAF